jgi:hypothetical protein
MANWQVISEHRRTTKGMLQNSWPLLMLGAFMLMFAAMFFSIRTRSTGNGTDMIIASGVSVSIALALLGGGVWKALLSASPVHVFVEGLQWRQGGRDHQRGWDELREVYRKELYHLLNGAKPSDWNRHSDLRLVFADGEQVRFNHSLSDYNRLAEFLQSKAAEQVLPMARKDLHGQGVSFGPVYISREGLRLPDGALSWEAVLGVRCRGGYLSVYDSRNDQHDIQLREVPNYPVLLRLMSEMPQLSGKI